jgi:predicted PurR-regulated permease PerM
MNLMAEQRDHPFSWEALTRIILTVVVVILVWKAADALVDILIALVLAAALSPVVKKMHKATRLPRLFSILLVLLVVLVPLAVLGFTVIPQLSTEVPNLINNLNTVVGHLPFAPKAFENFNVFDYLQSHPAFILASTQSIVLTIISIVAILVLGFYFVYDQERLFDLFLSIFPYREKTKLRELLGEVATVTGQYIRGNLIISVICSVIIFVGLWALQIPFALPLAIFAGILDLLPLVGQTIGAIPALIISFAISPAKGIAVLVLHMVYQQIENAVISPVIYNKALKLYPALSFLAVIVGASLFGILGAFLALPVAASIPAAFRYHENYEKRHQQ